MATDRKTYVSCTFEGVYLGARPVTKADGTPVTMKARDGKPGEALYRATIRVGEGTRESTLSITMKQSTLDNPLGDPDQGTLEAEDWVRIPGSISVEQSDRGVFVSQWGDQVIIAKVAIQELTAAAGKRLSVVAA